ncbi:MAG: hypothetical protein JNM17_23070 [Archangium sp.]|nr:hypothetical protein [Archangium sp.]
MALLLVVCACATAPRVVAPPVAAEPPREPPKPKPPPHPEYEALRPFHNYYRIVSIGPFRHHFVVFFHHFELVTALYDVPIRSADEAGASEPPVEFKGDSFGLITEAPEKDGEIPAEFRSMADAVKRDLQKREKGEASAMDVRYLGSWRPIVVEEIVFRPLEGISRHYTLVSTLAADDALTKIDGTAKMNFGHGGSSTLYGDPVPPEWIDVRIGRQGKAQLWKLYGTPSSFDQTTRGTFDAAVLNAARRVAKKQPGPRLSELQVELDRDVVPSDLEKKRPVIFYVNADSERREQVSAQTWIDPLNAFGGVERAEFRLSVPCDDGRECTFNVELRLRGPALPRDGNGETEVPLSIDYSVRGPGRVPVGWKPQFGTLETTARVWLDGPRAAFISVKDGIQLKPMPGVAQFKGFEPHLGFMGED